MTGSKGFVSTSKGNRGVVLRKGSKLHLGKTWKSGKSTHQWKRKGVGQS